MLRSPLVFVAIVVAATISLLPEAPGRAAGPVLSLTTISDHTVYLPINGMRDTGAFLQSGMSTATTAFFVSDASRLRVGQKIEVVDGALTEGMGIVAVTSDGNPATTDILTVTRGQYGTVAANHSIGKKIYADFTRADVVISGVADRNSGVTFTAPTNDSALAESSPAILSSPVDKVQTVAYVSDASVLAGPITNGVMESVPASIDGMYSTGATNLYNGFLASTGNSMSCDGDVGTKAYEILVRCYTLAATLGPSGNGRLGTVNLVAPRLSGVVNLTLSDVTLSAMQPPDPFGGGDPPISVQEVIGGNVAVGNPPPIAPSILNPTPGLTSVYLTPKNLLSLPTTDAATQNISVDVMVQNVPSPAQDGGHGLGGFQFKISWDRAAEDVTITNARPGYVDDGGQPWARGTNLSAAVNASVMTLPVSNAANLQPGWTARTDNEQLLITSVGATSIDVVRGYRGSTAASHSSGADVFAGPERVTVTRNVTPSPHNAGAPLRANNRLLSVSSHANLTASSVITIDSERFKLLQKPALGLNTGAGTLSGGLSAVATSSTISGAGVAAGSVIQVDAEWMSIATLSSSNATFKRGLWGTTPAAHSPGAPITSFGPLTNKVRVVRAVLGSTAAAHNTGTAIYDADGLGAFTASITGPNDGTYVVRAVYLGGMLTSTGRTSTCPTATTTANTANIACTSTGAQLGPQGGGIVASVDATGLVAQAGGPAKGIALTGTAADTSGDDLGATTVSGSFRVVKCPDVNADGVANFPGDVITLAKASVGLPVSPPATLAKFDLNSDNVINFPGDTLTAAKIVTQGQPSGLRCLP